MRHALRRYCQLVPALNRRTLEERDFWRLCALAGLPVFHLLLPVPGVYTLRRGQPAIWLDLRLSGQRWLKTAWHEFAHHLLHVPPSRPVTKFYPFNKYDLEAEAFVLLALWPEPKLRRLLREDRADDAPPARWELLHRFGL